MAENNPPPSKPPPKITLPPRSSMFTAAAMSPGPMSLVSSFFSDGDPDHDFSSFSQLLAGAMSPPADVSRNIGPPPEDGGGFSFQQGGVAASQPARAMFTIPPGLSPTGLLDSPVLFPLHQGSISNQQILSQMQMNSEYSSLSAAPASSMPQQLHFASTASLHQQVQLPLPDSKIMNDSSATCPLEQKPQPPTFSTCPLEQKPQPPTFSVDKPADDGYNWRKYGQKQVKGSEFPRSYYKCTYANCPVKKKVERSLEGQITEIIYKGQHNHPKPSKRTKDTGNMNDTVNPEFESLTDNPSKFKDGTSYFSSSKDQESSQATPEHVSGSSDSEEVGNAGAGGDGRDEDEPEPKRRNADVQKPEQASHHRTVTEPRIIVQTTSEVDLLDDGYRWRKYGQKVVKGNPYPRSYYKCTNPECNVRKHVERAASDPKAVITTYEGKHNHDVPAAKNSSHGNGIAPLQHPVVGRPLASRAGFGNVQQPSALLRFKEEQIS